ncbi:MAG: hypothetical protein Q8T11_06295 [Elusimicrobiota bacterium]|nr:hypothetical protein [Elusimicrobiota bacterium]
MKLWLVLLLAAPASARVVEAPVRAAPAALAGPASLGSAAVSFDGAGPLRPWLEVPGTPFLRLGSSLIDTRAFGATELLKAVSQTDGRPVIGIFETGTARVLNAFSLGSWGVRGHSDALPPGRDRSELGGYSFQLRRDGRPAFAGSGSVPATITPAVERAVLRHLGVRPAHLSPAERMRRLWLRVLDWAAALAK